MKKIFLSLLIGHLIFLGFAFRKAFGATPAYYGTVISTTTGKTTGYISGSWRIAASSATASTSTIVLDGTNGILKYDSDGTQTFTMSSGTITGLDGNPIYYKSRYYPRNSISGEEQASIYLKVDPSGSTTNQQVGIFGEITAEQQDTEAAFMKVMHKGAGDAIYVPMWTNSGVAFEAASFGNGTKGIISTLQTSDCFYTTLFNGLWGYDTVPGYGALYLDDMPGNAITIKRRVGSSDAQGTLRIVSSDLGTEYFKVNNDGSVVSVSTITAYAITASSGAIIGNSFSIGGNNYNMVVSTSGSSVNVAFGKNVSSTTVPVDIQSDPVSGYLMMFRRQNNPTEWFAFQQGAANALALRNYSDGGNARHVWYADGGFAQISSMSIGSLARNADSLLSITKGTGLAQILVSGNGTEASGIKMFWNNSASDAGFQVGAAGSYRTLLLNPNGGDVKIGDQIYYARANERFGIGTTAPSQKLHISSGTLFLDGTSPAVNVNNKAKIDNIGGYLVKLTNRSGAAISSGTLVAVSADYENAVTTASAQSIGTVAPYEADIANGAEVWITVSGIGVANLSSSKTCAAGQYIKYGTEAGTVQCGGLIGNDEMLGYSLTTQTAAGGQIRYVIARH